MSVRAFAAHLGVSERMVSKWESDGSEGIRLRAVNQAALDTSLAMAEPAVRVRFMRLVADRAVAVDALRLAADALGLIRHPIDGKLMVLVEAGPYTPPNGRPVWLPAFCIDAHPTTCDDFDEFAAVTGHPRPGQWPGGDAVAAVRWIDAQDYAQWASKSLPTELQLRRAATGEEGVVAGHLDEWCIDDLGKALRLRRGGGHPPGPTAFRTMLPRRDALALLGI
jgi:hypothetical protein